MPPAKAHERIFVAALHIELQAVVRTERGVLQESWSILYRMAPSIREHVTPLANPCPENGLAGQSLRINRFGAGFWEGECTKQLASDRGRRLSTYWPIR